MSATDFAAMKQAWRQVEAEAARLARLSLLDLFATREDRAERFTVSAPHITADFSKQRIDEAAMTALARLAHAADLAGWRDKLFAGAVVNTTEGRAAMHWALRATDASAEVRSVRERMAAFAVRIRPEIDAVVHLGIGGSDLGPRLVMDALKPLRLPGLQVRFAANVDGADVADAIEGLDPARTLLIVASKTFTTQETLANAEYVRAWGPAHVAAATADPAKAAVWGAPADNVFPFWDWVGGRYSLWSSVSLACVVALRDGAHERLLAGAAEMDAHFRDAPLPRNLPIVSGMVQTWNREALGRGSYAIVPYAERLRLLPAWLQQLEMESNGKGVTREGEPLARSACAITWGAAGTNAQHSFFQLLHQGVDEFPVEFVVNAGAHEGPAAHRTTVFANALAQARALMTGKSADQARAEMMEKGVDATEAERLAPHRAFPGDRPSTFMSIDGLTPEALGALLAFYEHRTFVQAVLAGVNPYDQWGVELGKKMASALLPGLVKGETPGDLDPSTAAWLKRLS